MNNLKMTERIDVLKDRMLSSPRYVSIEQARIITRIYKENENFSLVKLMPKTGRTHQLRVHLSYLNHPI